MGILKKKIINNLLLVFAQSDGQEKTFKTPQEAVEKAQDDFLKVLEMQNKNFDFGVTAGELKNAKSAALLKCQELNFDKIKEIDNIRSFAQLTDEAVLYVAPLKHDLKMITTVEVKKDNEMWMVAGLGDQSYSEALNELPEEIRYERLKDVSIYKVPNIQVVVYAVSYEEGEKCFTDYGQFHMKEAVPAERLYEVLREDVIRFQKEFRKELRKQELVD